MAEPRAPEDSLQPALLDRLLDDEPDKKLEPRQQRVMNKKRLRQAVLRDLAWLFNTTKHGSELDSPRYPFVRKSVLNYGLPGLSGRTASSLEIVDLERAIKQAILDYEPRILPGTLQVRAVETETLESHNVIGVDIRGELWAQPVPLELLVRTEIDLETGQVQLADLRASRVD